MAKILIVDDHADNREFLRVLLSSMGHQVLEAADGVAGFAQLECHHLYVLSVMPWPYWRMEQ